MQTFDNICRLVAKQLGEEYELVRQICMYLFKFIEQVMKDPEDTHDVLLHDLFRFRLKARFKENKQKEYSSK